MIINETVPSACKMTSFDVSFLFIKEGLRKVYIYYGPVGLHN